MEAIVLAGGPGTRLREVVSDRPKVLADVDGRPFLSYVLAWLYRCGVTHAVIAAGYMAESIRAQFKDKYLGLLLDYSVEKTPLGTGGAVKKALSLCREKAVIVVNGDTFFDVELEKMLARHTKNGASLTVALKKTAHGSRYGMAETSGDSIVRFREKGGDDSGYVNGGVYVVDRGLLDGVSDECFSFERVVLESSRFEKQAFFPNGYFIDIGVPDDYAKACREMKTAETTRVRKALFLDRDGTLNEDTGHLYKPEDFRFIDGMPQLIADYRSRGYVVAVVTNQAGIAKGLYGEEQVRELHEYINALLTEGCNTCVDGFFFCPHHPDGCVPEYTKSCDCRKPAPGLIFRAVEYFRSLGIVLDLKNSVLIGDKPWDTAAGKAAGIGQTILKDSPGS